MKTLLKEAKGNDVTSLSRHKTKELAISNGRKEKEVKQCAQIPNSKKYQMLKPTMKI